MATILNGETVTVNHKAVDDSINTELVGKTGKVVAYENNGFTKLNPTLPILHKVEFTNGKTGWFYASELDIMPV